jgi:signal transduction histidine kinase
MERSKIMGFIGFSVWSTYQVLFFVALAIIFIMCIIIGIQSAKAADRKQDIKQKIIDYEKDIADRNRVISKQRQEIDFLTLKLKELQERSKP